MADGPQNTRTLSTRRFSAKPIAQKSLELHAESKHCVLWHSKLEWKERCCTGISLRIEGNKFPVDMHSIVFARYFDFLWQITFQLKFDRNEMTLSLLTFCFHFLVRRKTANAHFMILLLITYHESVMQQRHGKSLHKVWLVPQSSFTSSLRTIRRHTHAHTHRAKTANTRLCREQPRGEDAAGRQMQGNFSPVVV